MANQVKRLFDLFLGLGAAAVLALPILVVAILVHLTSKGPVLYWSDRVGEGNDIFSMPKFRSMRAGTQAVATHLLKDPNAHLTPIGSFLRKSSLDELPQLFNVLAGSMSMVGPRPHATATKAADILFEEAVANYVARHKVKPGITGLAQVHGYRGETDTVEKLQKRVEYDLAYIENWSLGLDAFILLRTLSGLANFRQKTVALRRCGLRRS